MKLREKIFIWFMALVYLMGQWGCTTGRYEYPKPEPLSETYRAQLGTIGVVSEPRVPDIQFDRPLPPTQQPAGVLERTGQGALKGSQWWWDNVLSTDGFETAFTSMMMVFPPAGIVVAFTALILTLPVTIFGGLGGAIGGLASDEPSATVYTEYVEENEARLRASLGEYPIQEPFKRSFLKEIRARTSHTFVVISEEELQTSEKMVAQGVDTVLELSVQRIWLKRLDDGEGEWNPPMVLVLVVRARLVQATEKTDWYDQTFVHETEKLPYDWWVHPIRFQGAIEMAYQKLAEQLIEKLFLSNSTTSPTKNDTSVFFSETTLISQQSKSAHQLPLKG